MSGITKPSTGGGGGSGTVTSVSVTTVNGVSGSVLNPTTTPAISLTLGAITPASVAAVGTVTGSNLSNTNTGDQTSIVGITGTKAQFDAAVSDGNILYVGDITQYTDELAQDAVGTILTDSAEIDFTYNDAAPTITASIIASSIDETKLDVSVNASLDLADSAAQLAFRTIVVAGQSDVVAETNADTLTLVAGTNVTLTTNAATDTITITASGGGGSASSVSVDVDFGFASGQQGDMATATVAAAWVAAGTKIVCCPFAVATATHDPEDYALEGIQAYATNIQAGVGFDVIASCQNGTFGVYTIHCLGV